MPPRSKVPLNIQAPTLRPTATPVDIFYQPEPPVPGAVVDNSWLQLAQAMKGLSPSLQGFLKAQDAQKKKKVPGEAERAAGAFGKTTDAELKAAYDRDLKEHQRASAGQREMSSGKAAQATPYPPFDLKQARSQYRQQHLALARRFSSMGRSEAEAWLEENQKLFPGHTLNYASRPDFLLHLKEQFGIAWAKEAKVFQAQDGSMQTYEVALDSHRDEFIQAEDKEAWLREFEQPLAEGLSAEGQAFRLGAVGALAQTRQRLKAVAESYGQQLRAKQSKRLATQELVETFTTGIASLSFAPLPTPPPNETKKQKEARIQKEEAYQAHTDGMATGIYKVLARVLVGDVESIKVLFDSLEQAGEQGQDLDPDDDDLQVGQLFDYVRSLPRDPSKPNGKRLGEVFAQEFRNVEDALESRATTKRRQDAYKGTYDDALLNAEDLILKKIAALDENKPEDKKTLDSFSTIEGYKTFVASFSDDLTKVLKEQLGDKQADQRLSVLSREIATTVFQRQEKEDKYITQAAQEAYNDMALATAKGEKSLAEIHTYGSTAKLSSAQLGELRSIFYSEEAQKNRKEGKSAVFDTTREQLLNSIPENMLDSAGKANLFKLTEEAMAHIEGELSKLTDPAKRAEYLRKAPTEALEHMKDLKGYDTLAEGSLGQRPDAIILNYGKEWAGTALETRFIPLIPDSVDDEDGNPIEDPNADIKRTEAAHHFSIAMQNKITGMLGLEDASGKKLYGDVSNINAWGPEIVRHAVFGTLPAAATKESAQKVHGRGLSFRNLLERASRGVVDLKLPDTPPIVGETVSEQLEKKRVANAAQKKIRGQYWQRLPGSIDTTLVAVSGVENFSAHMKVYAENMKSGAVALSRGRANDDSYEDFASSAKQLLTAPGVSARIPRPGQIVGWDRVEYTNNPNMPAPLYASVYFNSAKLLGLADQDPGSWYHDNGDAVWETALDAGKQTKSQARAIVENSYIALGLSLDEVIRGTTMFGVDIGTLWNGGNIPWGDIPLSAGDPKDWETQKALYADPDTREESKLFKAMEKLGIDEKPSLYTKDGIPLTNREVFLHQQEMTHQARLEAIGPDGLRLLGRLPRDILRLNAGVTDTFIEAPLLFEYMFSPGRRDHTPRTPILPAHATPADKWDFRVHTTTYEALNTNGEAHRAWMEEENK